jgi:hypothetical protein
VSVFGTGESLIPTEGQMEKKRKEEWNDRVIQEEGKGDIREVTFCSML